MPVRRGFNIENRKSKYKVVGKKQAKVQARDHLPKVVAEGL